MVLGRRQFLTSSVLAGATYSRAAAPRKLGIPGPYRGRVVGVQHPASVITGAYQREAVRAMVRKGMMELTGAPDPVAAWRVFVEPGDVVGIKLNPVGQPYLISAPEVVQTIIEALEEAGIQRKDMVAYDRYYAQFRAQVLTSGCPRACAGPPPRRTMTPCNWTWRVTTRTITWRWPSFCPRVIQAIGTTGALTWPSFSPKI